jgi:hypothetical protein
LRLFLGKKYFVAAALLASSASANTDVVTLHCVSDFYRDYDAVTNVIMAKDGSWFGNPSSKRIGSSGASWLYELPDDKGIRSILFFPHALVYREETGIVGEALKEVSTFHCVPFQNPFVE